MTNKIFAQLFVWLHANLLFKLEFFMGNATDCKISRFYSHSERTFDWEGHEVGSIEQMEH